MDAMTRACRGWTSGLGRPAPVLAAMCAVLAGMPAGAALPTASALVALLAAMGNALYRRRHPRLVAATSAIAAVVSASATCSCGTADRGLTPWLLVESVFLLCVLAQVVRSAPRVHALLTGGAVAIAMVLSPLRLAVGARASPRTADVGTWCLCWGLLAAVGIAIGLYLRSLDEAREESIRAARREQRLRLAGDLHDWLAHEVTGLVLEAQAARIPGRTDVDVGNALRSIEDAGVRVLDSIDRALCWLRSDQDPGDGIGHERSATIADLPALLARFETLGSMEVRLNLDERAADVRPEIADAAHRVVLEALTNVRRHSPAARQIAVDVHRNGVHLIVRVWNDGVRRPGLLRRREGGTGLRGLTERVMALGGTLWAGPVGSAGWALHTVLPVVR